MTFSDAGTVITLGTYWVPLAGPIFCLAIAATLVAADNRFPILKRWFLGTIVLVLPVVIAWHQGEFLQFTTEGIRETRWYREVDFLPWRHVESAVVEPRDVKDDRGQVTRRQQLVLRLKTGEDWFRDLDELRPAHIERIGQFVRAHLSARR